MNRSTTTTLVTSGALIFGVSAYLYHIRVIDKLKRKTAHETAQRQAERKGRIRAEVKLRTLTKEAHKKENACSDNPKSEEGNMLDLELKCIGTIVSPFTKRMGTPRQGALAPNARGFVQLSCHEETIDGMDSYSHCWIIFSFHANTNNPGSNKKAKVRPPRAGGVKVGQLATRSPHRPNNIGLSLVKVDCVDKKTRRLYISALDLVNGTPVYDIKPYVPWDVAGFSGAFHDGLGIKVPEWVRQDDELQSVTFSTEAQESLNFYLLRGYLAPLYTADNGGYDAARKSIMDVLAQDPRGVKKRGSSSNDTYRLIFCSVEIEFVVSATSVEVVGVNCLDFDKATTYVDGVPLIMNISDDS